MKPESMGTLCVLGLALIASPAAAGTVEIHVSAGASLAGSHDPTPVAFVDLAGTRRQGRHATWQPTLTIGVIRGRDGTGDLDRNVALAGVGVRLVDWWRNAFATVEVAGATQTTAAISSHGQFITGLGWQGDHHVIASRHISNADLGGGKNLGETMLLVGARF
ncbi:MAG: hypothetical protein J0L88_01375 [Xanthomonadales bacterium]|nr:hypothetical protein [Xanthomonadales bacterium]